MVFAGVWKAPVVFLCDNNGWAISCPTSQQTASESFAIKGKAYGVPGVVVDGNDVLAVRRAVGEAVDRARSGGGPTLIEAVTYRFGGHSSSDDPRRYRDEAEVLAWRQRDPIARFESWLRERGLLNDALRDRVAADAKAEIQAAVDAVAGTPPPALATLFDDVYAEPTPRLRAQRDECLERFARHGQSTTADGAFPL
jgi:pyruvate dehydrogenase E1 component alpha subunit/2-oxoisovalerate dehydrogenase E1 component alpha subunit